MQLSRHNKKLTTDKPTNTNELSHSKHKRKIIWYNPPFSKNVSTEFGKSSLSLKDQHFSKEHIYNSILNRHKTKVNYSCMQNMKQIIKNHNMNSFVRENQPRELVQTDTTAVSRHLKVKDREDVTFSMQKNLLNPWLIFEIEQVLGSHELTGHYHFWPHLPKNHQSNF